MPAWVVRYPSAEVSNAKSILVGTKKMGAFAQSTNDTMDEVAEYFERELRGAGFRVWNTLIAAGEKRLVIGTVEEPQRFMEITVTASEDGTELEAQYGSE
jgi:hypothetical protein